jgi:ethanolamine kinase
MFHNGRVEEFLHCITLTPQQMCDPHFVPRIAQLLRRFHAADIHLPRTPTLWGVIAQWLEQAQQLEFTDAAKAAAYAQLDFRAMAAEIQGLHQLCDAMESPVVFGHNDLLSGNLLVAQEPGFDPAAADLDRPVTVIDFEYGAYTYRGFDIGNHFNEYAGFECDYTRWVGTSPCWGA